jgi:hypothetical protein
VADVRSFLIWAAVLAGVVVLVFALDRLALWMEARGWLYWRKTRHSSGGSLGSAFLEIQTLVDPGKRHVLEVRREEKTEEVDSGAPPDAKGCAGSRTRGEEHGE